MWINNLYPKPMLPIPRCCSIPPPKSPAAYALELLDQMPLKKKNSASALELPRCCSLPPPKSPAASALELLDRMPLKKNNSASALELLDQMPLKKNNMKMEKKKNMKMEKKKRVFFLDLNSICYSGRTYSLKSFCHWASLLFPLTGNDPLIAVLDGDASYKRRRSLLPSYKANRKYFTDTYIPENSLNGGHLGRSQAIADVLAKCNIPVVRVYGNEADDVVATLTEQVLRQGYKAVIASPDKDFKQLLSDDVQLILPIKELGRWSFYTKEDYIAQHNCDPQSELSRRSIMGDEVDNVPGIQTLVPAFGRNTCMKLLKKHGTLDNLLNAAAVRSVGKQYVQDAVTKHADFLRGNYNVLALKRDVNVNLKEEWLVERDGSKDSFVLSSFLRMLEGRERTFHMVDKSDQGRNKSY